MRKKKRPTKDRKRSFEVITTCTVRVYRAEIIEAADEQAAFDTARNRALNPGIEWQAEPVVPEKVKVHAFKELLDKDSDE